MVLWQWQCLQQSAAGAFASSLHICLHRLCDSLSMGIVPHLHLVVVMHHELRFCKQGDALGARSRAAAVCVLLRMCTVCCPGLLLWLSAVCVSAPLLLQMLLAVFARGVYHFGEVPSCCLAIDGCECQCARSGRGMWRCVCVRACGKGVRLAWPVSFPASQSQEVQFIAGPVSLAGHEALLSQHLFAFRPGNRGA